MQKEIILLVGPPGSGKSTLAKKYREEQLYFYINQDSQGKEEHKRLFQIALDNHSNIVVDRMNFSIEQRDRYLIPARANGYRTKIIVLHESYNTCFNRCKERQGHETITTERHARSALELFFKKYERVKDSEADSVKRIWPGNTKPKAILCDLDGTLCNIDHRLHFVKGEKKNWPEFFNQLTNDTVNKWCADILDYMPGDIVLCSGRPDSHMQATTDWLNKHGIAHDELFMRRRSDYRPDNIVKEQILDFEILTRYEPYFAIDDRKQVVDMWRRRGIVTLQCAEGNF